MKGTEILEFDHPGELNLSIPSETGSRLGLTPLETPATVEIIDRSNLEKIGAKNIADAVNTLPGVLSGEFPASPHSFSIRGFTSNQITLLRDGIWAGSSQYVKSTSKRM